MGWLNNILSSDEDSKYELGWSQYTGGSPTRDPSILIGDLVLPKSGVDYQLGSALNKSVNPSSSFSLFSEGGLKGIGSIMGGVGALGQAYAGIKGLDLARDSMQMQQDQWSKNYEAQRTATNNAIANQNAWKAAQGRADLGQYVGDWSTLNNLR